MLITNSKGYEGKILLPKGWEQSFLEKVRFDLKKKKINLDKH